MTDPILVGTAVVVFGSLVFVGVLALLGWWYERRGALRDAGGRR